MFIKFVNKIIVETFKYYYLVTTDMTREKSPGEQWQRVKRVRGLTPNQIKKETGYNISIDFKFPEVEDRYVTINRDERKYSPSIVRISYNGKVNLIEIPNYGNPLGGMNHTHILDYIKTEIKPNLEKILSNYNGA